MGELGPDDTVVVLTPRRTATSVFCAPSAHPPGRARRRACGSRPIPPCAAGSRSRVRVAGRSRTVARGPAGATRSAGPLHCSDRLDSDEFTTYNVSITCHKKGRAITQSVPGSTSGIRTGWQQKKMKGEGRKWPQHATPCSLASESAACCRGPDRRQRRPRRRLPPPWHWRKSWSRQSTAKPRCSPRRSRSPP